VLWYRGLPPVKQFLSHKQTTSWPTLQPERLLFAFVKHYFYRQRSNSGDVIFVAVKLGLLSADEALRQTLLMYSADLQPNGIAEQLSFYSTDPERRPSIRSTKWSVLSVHFVLSNCGTWKVSLRILLNCSTLCCIGWCVLLHMKQHGCPVSKVLARCQAPCCWTLNSNVTKKRLFVFGDGLGMKITMVCWHRMLSNILNLLAISSRFIFSEKKHDTCSCPGLPEKSYVHFSLNKVTF